MQWNQKVLPRKDFLAEKPLGMYVVATSNLSYYYVAYCSHPSFPFLFFYFNCIYLTTFLLHRKFDFDKMNIHGGSLAIGHPFGATGARLFTTASNRLQREDKKYALLTACADGGLATACILEKY